jgi:hypothetical protein
MALPVTCGYHEKEWSTEILGVRKFFLLLLDAISREASNGGAGKIAFKRAVNIILTHSFVSPVLSLALNNLSI